MTPDSAGRMARYNQWINDKLYRAARQLPDHEYRRGRQVFFGSIHGTLNHLLLADRVWLGRFMGIPYPVVSLDQELYPDLDGMALARRETDGTILEWVESLTPAKLAGEFRYTSISSRDEKCCALWEAVLHVFNHQTHHRGQVTAMLSQAGLDYGVTDLVGMEKTALGY